MTIKQYDQFMVDPAFSDVVVDAQWLKNYFQQHEQLVRSHKKLQEKYDLKGEQVKKKQLKHDIEILSDYIDHLEAENEGLHKRLGIANGTVAKQISHIEMLNRQLDIQDKAINRKDEQFLGLRKAYQDALINNEV